MASIRKRHDKWQVQFRRKGACPVTRSFLNRRDAETWARQIEVQADRYDLPVSPTLLKRYTLGELVQRYLTTESPRKKGYEREVIILSAFLRHPICSKSLADLSAFDFVNYRDERLKTIKPSSLQRQLSPLHNLFEVARSEWGLPIKENPLDGVKLECRHNGRERRLREGELERISSAASKTKNPHILPIIMFALQTGLRRSEILAATWK
jgi:integrase